MTVLRSLAFNLLFVMGTVAGLISLLWTVVAPWRVLLGLVRRYLASVAWLERHLLGLDWRVVGRDHVPDGPFLLAAKHQSTWETLKIHLLFPEAAIVLKRELMWLPLWGWYAAKAGMIPIDRGGRAKALSGMVRAARQRLAEGRPVVIFPQGTRTAPGTHQPYHVGVAALYRELGVPVVPMAVNSGVFWGRRAFRKRPGTITVEFLPPIPPGLDRKTFLRRLETELEAATDRLVVAAGGPATPRPVRAAPAPRAAAAGPVPLSVPAGAHAGEAALPPQNAGAAPGSGQPAG